MDCCDPAQKPGQKIEHIRRGESCYSYSSFSGTLAAASQIEVFVTLSYSHPHPSPYCPHHSMSILNQLLFDCGETSIIIYKPYCDKTVQEVFLHLLFVSGYDPPSCFDFILTGHLIRLPQALSSWLCQNQSHQSPVTDIANARPPFTKVVRGCTTCDPWEWISMLF